MNKQRLMELAGVHKELVEDDGPWIVVSFEDGHFYAEGPFTRPSEAHTYRSAWLKETGADESTTQVVSLRKSRSLREPLLHLIHYFSAVKGKVLSSDSPV